MWDSGERAHFHLCAHSMTNRSRRWCFTLNNPTRTDEEELEQLGAESTVTYLIYGDEKGENGTRHFQGYIEFKNGRSLAGCKKLIARAHWEQAKGSPESNRTYCSKEGRVQEWGSISRQGARNDMSAVREIIQTSGSMRKVIQEVSSYQAVRMAEKILTYTVVARTAPPMVLWIHGKTGVGKTRCAWELYGTDDTWAWNCSKWFDGYDGHETVIFDDYRGTELPFTLMLRLLDRYPMSVEVKGGYRPWAAKRIIVTSQLTPEDAHGHHRGEDLNQLLRRITLVWNVERDGHPDTERVREELAEVVRVEEEDTVTEHIPTSDEDEVPCTPGQD